MRELDLETRQTAHAPAPEAGPAAGGPTAARERTGPPTTLAIDVIGAGRAGTSIASGLRNAGHDVPGPLGRGERPRPSADAVLLCVPDAALPDLAGSIAKDIVVGHCCGAAPAALLGRDHAFSLHPLMTLDGDPTALVGAWAAVDATGHSELALATRLASDLGMTPIRIAASDRAAYHAAASIASNFLTTLEGAAEELASTAGLPREALVPLVERTVANWARGGAAGTLTGPVARGDTDTVSRQREQVENRTPWHLPLFDALTDSTADLAAAREDR